MKDFSNETKKDRRKAVLKVVLKRYSFIVWLPALLVLFNFIGALFWKIIMALGGKSPYIEGANLYNYFFNIMIGLLILVSLLMIIVLVLLVVDNLIKYLKKKTLKEDFLECVHGVKEMFVDLFLFLIRIPKKIFERIKDEKRRFKNAVEEEMKEKEKD